MLISLFSLQTELAKYAEEMGAVHRYDLTLDVTHLIVGDYNTPKYRYVARERPDVRPMTTKWIEAIRELWINDDEIDMESLEREHTIPTFHSLKFSMTGCDDRKSTLPFEHGMFLINFDQLPKGWKSRS